MKRASIGFLALAFAFSMIFMMTSCAKKQVKVEEMAKPSPPAVEKKREMPPAMQPGEEEAARRAEAERRARQREREMAQLRGEIQMFESENIYFDFDRSELKPEAKAVLTKKARWLREHPGYKVRIEGNCDERGTNEYNLALGERRANAAWKFLNALGVAGDRMSTLSYGEERPAVAGHNEAAWAKNRRDEFKLIK